MHRDGFLKIKVYFSVVFNNISGCLKKEKIEYKTKVLQQYFKIFNTNKTKFEIYLQS